jgi:hypothetical protein
MVRTAPALLAIVALASGCDLLLDLPGAGWDVRGEHPCAEYRIDALLVEDAGEALWVGCGSGSTGFGLFHSDDGGRTWDAPRSTPTDFFATFRVNHLQRGPDGALLVGGAQNPGDGMLVAFDDASGAVTPILARGTTVDRSFQIGTFQVTDDGRALAESLTGNGLLYRPSAQADFDPVDWASDGGSYQILHTAQHDGAFYGSGSTIAEPFRLFVPAADAGEALRLDVVTLPDTGGELWGVAVDAGGLVAAGVSQDDDYAVAVTGPITGRQASDFTIHDLRSALRQDAPSRAYGVCRDGDRVLVLGDYSRRSESLAVFSDDGGATFRELTTGTEDGGAPGPILDRCAFLADGSAIVAGGEGFVARVRP